MYIQGPNSIQCLSYPVQRRDQNTPLKDVQISHNEAWKKDHWRSIECAYRRSPYFEYYEDRLGEVFMPDISSAVEFNIGLLKLILQLLQSDLTFELSESYQSSENFDADYRNSFNAKQNTHPFWFEPQSYTQVFRTFEPNLSILDLLFNEGPQSMGYLRSCYKEISR